MNVSVTIYVTRYSQTMRKREHNSFTFTNRFMIAVCRLRWETNTYIYIFKSDPCRIAIYIILYYSPWLWMAGRKESNKCLTANTDRRHERTSQPTQPKWNLTWLRTTELIDWQRAGCVSRSAAHTRITLERQEASRCLVVPYHNTDRLCVCVVCVPLCFFHWYCLRTQHTHTLTQTPLLINHVNFDWGTPVNSE